MVVESQLGKKTTGGYHKPTPSSARSSRIGSNVGVSLKGFYNESWVKHRSYTVEFKVLAVDLLWNNNQWNLSEAARKFIVGRKRIQEWDQVYSMLPALAICVQLVQQVLLQNVHATIAYSMCASRSAWTLLRRAHKILHYNYVLALLPTQQLVYTDKHMVTCSSHNYGPVTDTMQYHDVIKTVVLLIRFT